MKLESMRPFVCWSGWWFSSPLLFDWVEPASLGWDMIFSFKYIFGLSAISMYWFKLSITWAGSFCLLMLMSLLELASLTFFLLEESLSMRPLTLLAGALIPDNIRELSVSSIVRIYLFSVAEFVTEFGMACPALLPTGYMFWELCTLNQGSLIGVWWALDVGAESKLYYLRSTYSSYASKLCSVIGCRPLVIWIWRCPTFWSVSIGDWDPWSMFENLFWVCARSCTSCMSTCCEEITEYCWITSWDDNLLLRLPFDCCRFGNFGPLPYKPVRWPSS